MLKFGVNDEEVEAAEDRFHSEIGQVWDTHDLTDFEDDLEEVTEPVFVRDTAIKVLLESYYVEAAEPMAQAKGVSRE